MKCFYRIVPSQNRSNDTAVGQFEKDVLFIIFLEVGEEKFSNSLPFPNKGRAKLTWDGQSYHEEWDGGDYLKAAGILKRVLPNISKEISDELEMMVAQGKIIVFCCEKVSVYETKIKQVKVEFSRCPKRILIPKHVSDSNFRNLRFYRYLLKEAGRISVLRYYGAILKIYINVPLVLVLAPLKCLRELLRDVRRQQPAHIVTILFSLIAYIAGEFHVPAAIFRFIRNVL